MKINNGYVRFYINKTDTPTISIVPTIKDATVCSPEQIVAVGQDVYEYAIEIHNTLVEVIIVL